MSTIASSGTGALAGYERLRGCALAARVEDPGLALMMRRGLRAWLEARAELDSVAAPTAPPSPGTRMDEPSAGSLRAELARVMGTMLLGALGEEVRA